MLLQDIVAGVLRRRLVHGKDIRLPPPSLLGEKLDWRECLFEIGIFVHPQVVQHYGQLASRIRFRHLITMTNRYRLTGSFRATRNVNIVSAVPPIAFLYYCTALTSASAHGSPFSMTRLRYIAELNSLQIRICHIKLLFETKGLPGGAYCNIVGAESPDSHRRKT